MRLLINLFLLAVSLVILVVAGVSALLMTLPDVHKLETCFTTTMYEVKLCSESDNYAHLKEVSPFVLHAVIASEDGTFYSHDGFDWHEIEESFNSDLHSGKIRRGGSTLTQQLAKNVFLGKEKSVWRKLKEAYLAHGIEKHYTKDFILEKYLNVVEFGQDLYGIKPASLHYFHKSPSQLNPLEAAYLAFLLPNPKGYSKGFKTGKLTPFANKMVAMILKRMESYGKLTPAAYETAMAQLPNFPWSSLRLESFHGMPSYSLEAATQPPVDEQKVEEEIKTEPGEGATAAPDSAAPSKEEEPAGDADPD